MGTRLLTEHLFHVRKQSSTSCGQPLSPHLSFSVPWEKICGLGAPEVIVSPLGKTCRDVSVSSINSKLFRSLFERLQVLVTLLQVHSQGLGCFPFNLF